MFKVLNKVKDDEGIEICKRYTCDTIEVTEEGAFFLCFSESTRQTKMVRIAASPKMEDTYLRLDTVETDGSEEQYLRLKPKTKKQK